MPNITLNHITKIEGHATIDIEVDQGKLKKVELRAIEGARFFEGILRGRRYDECYEISSRICGICSCAHTVASVQAMEKTLGIQVSENIRNSRLLCTLSEKIRSHATHLYVLGLPDYLGYESVIAMAPKYKKEVVRALKMIKLGNEMTAMVGGREMHVVTMLVGGVSRVIDNKQREEMITRLKDVKGDCIRTIELFTKLEYPSFERKKDFACLSRDDSYGEIDGKIACLSGKGFEVQNMHDFYNESYDLYSTSKYSLKEGKDFAVGVLARVNQINDKFMPETQKQIKRFNIKFPIYNPFKNNLLRSFELLNYVEMAIDLLEKNELKQEPLPQIKPVAGHGIACVEAPRGLLWHEYETDAKGMITKANIITPTVQNLKNIEEDLKAYLPSILNLQKKKIIIEIEKLLRAYDPCFSCSTHSLKINWN